MSENQPLLACSSDDGNKRTKPNLFNKFIRCCSIFGLKSSDNEYKKKKTSVSLFCLFRFADRIDLFILSIALIATLILTFCLTTNLVLLGRLAGTFTLEPFNSSYLGQQNKVTGSNENENGCPWGVEPSSCNYDRLQRSNSSSDPAKLLSPVDLGIVTLRNNTMNILYLLLIFGSIEIICSYITDFTMISIAKRQSCRIRKLLLQSLIQRNISYYDTNEMSRVNVKLFDNIDSIERGIGFELGILLLGICFTILNVIVSLVIYWQLALVLMCILPLIIGGLYGFAKLTRNETIKELNSYSRAGQIVEEVFSSLRTVFSLNGQRFEQNRYARKLQATHGSSVRKGIMFGLFVGWLFVMVCITYFVGFVVSSRLIVYEECSNVLISNILTILILFADSINYLSYISPCFQSVAEACSAAKDVFDLIDEAKLDSVNETDLLKENSCEKQSVNINGDIEFVNVSFAYPTRQDVIALQNINLTARAGEITALVGHSGSGKSTCISLLLRYYEPSSGKITINNRSITEYGVKELRENIGVVNQEPILFNTSIYENIRYGKENATKAEIEEAAQQANAHHFIMQLPHKYETIVGERGIQLSGGEKQRVALARVLVKQPNILLLDEATSALDNQNERIFQEALDRACKNRTTIVIAHRLSTIQNANCIYVFDKGCVVEQGTHEILMEKEQGLYKQMINAQQIETIDDNIDEITSESDIQTEEENQISDHVHLLKDGQHDETDKVQNIQSSSKQKSVILRLLSMNKLEWLAILIGCTMSTIAGISQIIIILLLPKITSMFFEDCLYVKQWDNIILPSCLFLLIGIVIFIVRFFQFTAFAVSGSKLTERIRSKAFESLLRQEVAYFDRPENSSGAISNRLSSDARSVQQMAGPRLGLVCEAVIMTILGLVLSFLLNYQLALILFIYLAFIIIIIYVDIRFKAKIDQRSGLTLEQASALTADVLDNIRTVKQLTAEKTVLKQYSELIDQSDRIQRDPLIFSALPFALVFSTFAYALVAIYWCALVLVERHELNPKNMIMIFAFVPYLIQITSAFWIIIADGGTLVSSAQCFFDLFDRIPTINNGSTEGKKPDSFGGNIEFSQVKFTYPSRSTSSSILNHFQLSIKQGQRIALIGSSGCGKSTAIQLLERFYDVTHGHLRFDGIDIRQLNIHWIRSCFGLVSQEPILFDMTIAENIAYAQDIVRMEDIIDAANKANIHQFIQQLPQGYQTRVGPRGHQLSGGEKQRIVIARALIRKPKVLLFDEATSAMDVQNEQIVQQTLENLQTMNVNQTMLIIAHRLSTIRSCDLICVLHHGRIIESGTHTDLMQRRGAYYRMLLQSNL